MMYQEVGLDLDCRSEFFVEWVSSESDESHDGNNCNRREAAQQNETLDGLKRDEVDFPNLSLI
jgi:hypothetical protein